MKKESKQEYLQFVNDNQNKFETEEFINKLRHDTLNKENVDTILNILGLSPLEIYTMTRRQYG